MSFTFIFYIFFGVWAVFTSHIFQNHRNLALQFQVVENWPEKGISGFTVFKFRLKRVEDQPLLTTGQVLYFCPAVRDDEGGSVSPELYSCN